MLNQLMHMMQKQKQSGKPTVAKPSPSASKPAAGGAAPGKPSDVLPLDDDERGYGNF
jgi:hypothetical protein